MNRVLRRLGMLLLSVGSAALAGCSRSDATQAVVRLYALER